MSRLVEIANAENYDEFKVTINRKLQVEFYNKVYQITDDAIVL
jgi:hypothetical protein